MGNITSQVKSEIRQLPFMIGKLLGGMLAVIGFTAAVVILTRKADPSLADILPTLLSGGLGIVIFVISSRLSAKRLAEHPADNVLPGDRARMSILSWAILLLAAAVFLLITFHLTR